MRLTKRERARPEALIEQRVEKLVKSEGCSAREAYNRTARELIDRAARERTAA